MKGFTEFIEKKIAPVLLKIANFKYVEIAQGTFIPITPLLIVGSLFLLLAAFPLEAYKTMIGEFSAKFAALSGIGTATIAVFIAVTSSYATVQWYKVHKKEDGDIIGSIILSLASFMIMIPMQTVELLTSTADKKEMFTGIPSQFLGAQGVFVALIVGIVTTEARRYLVNKKITIKMPDAVPPMVSQAFVNLIPAVIILTSWWLIRVVFNVDLPKIIMDLFKPLVAAGDSFGVVAVVTLLNRTLWTVGINGGSVVGAVGGPIWTQMNIANLAAFEAGTPLPHMFTGAFYDVYIWVGLAPLTLLMIASKSARLKTLGALSLAPAIFNIGEPLIFGLPIMLNPLLMIPFIFSYLIIGIISSTLTYFGILAVPVLTAPWITPAPIKAYLSTNGSLLSVAFIFAMWAVIALCFYPFLKIVEKQDLAEDAVNEFEQVEKEVA